MKLGMVATLDDSKPTNQVSKQEKSSSFLNSEAQPETQHAPKYRRNPKIPVMFSEKTTILWNSIFCLDIARTSSIQSHSSRQKNNNNFSHKLDPFFFSGATIGCPVTIWTLPAFFWYSVMMKRPTFQILLAKAWRGWRLWLNKPSHGTGEPRKCQVGFPSSEGGHPVSYGKKKTSELSIESWLVYNRDPYIGLCKIPHTNWV